jgi:exodeoxyribonuclease V alpha subunit
MSQPASEAVLPSQLAQLFLRLDPALDDSTLALVSELAAANQSGHVCLPIAHRPERGVCKPRPCWARRAAMPR